MTPQDVNPPTSKTEDLQPETQAQSFNEWFQIHVDLAATRMSRDTQELLHNTMVLAWNARQPEIKASHERERVLREALEEIRDLSQECCYTFEEQSFKATDLASEALDKIKETK